MHPYISNANTRQKLLSKFYSAISFLLLFTFVIFLLPSAVTAKKPSDVTIKIQECDIWGADFFNPELSRDEDGYVVEPFPVGPFPKQIAKIWNNIFKATKKEAETGKQFIYCLKDGRFKYDMSAVFHSETEGTYFNMSKVDSKAACTKDNFTDKVIVLPLPQKSLSKKCSFLEMGITQKEIKKHLGKAHVQAGMDWYYLEENTIQDRKACARWLQADQTDLCCYPGMSLSFSNGRLKQIRVGDGRGESPHCDKQPDKN